MIVCKNCGTRGREQDSFCASCGNFLDGDTEASPDEGSAEPYRPEPPRRERGPARPAQETAEGWVAPDVSSPAMPAAPVAISRGPVAPPVRPVALPPPRQGTSAPPEPTLPSEAGAHPPANMPAPPPPPLRTAVSWRVQQAPVPAHGSAAMAAGGRDAGRWARALVVAVIGAVVAGSLLSYAAVPAFRTRVN